MRAVIKALIDTDVVIDVLDRREPFFRDSYGLRQCAVEGKLEAFMSVGAVTDVYYIISRSIHNASAAKEKIIGLSALVNFCDTLVSDINAALTLNMVDFENAVTAATAKREKASYIVTRNEADFKNSPVPAISPALLLRELG
jgi:predicted nucleic acid-binding protein